MISLSMDNIYRASKLCRKRKLKVLFACRQWAVLLNEPWANVHIFPLMNMALVAGSENDTSPAARR